MDPIKQRYGPQAADTWRALARQCASDSLCRIQEDFRRRGVKPLNILQAAFLIVHLRTVIAAAFDAVAVEAMKGEDVSQAASLHNAEHAEAVNSRAVVTMRQDAEMERELIKCAKGEGV